MSGMQWTSFRDQIVIDAIQTGRGLVFVRKELADTTDEALPLASVQERARLLISEGRAIRFTRGRKPLQRGRESLQAARLDVMERGMPVLRIREDACRWPIGDPREEDFRFCCAKIEDREGQPYCPTHRARSLRVPCAQPAALAPFSRPRIAAHHEEAPR